MEKRSTKNLYIKRKRKRSFPRSNTKDGTWEDESMIKEIRQKDLAECVRVIRNSFATVAKEFNITEENFREIGEKLIEIQ